jgi:hypothetical protein
VTDEPRVPDFFADGVKLQTGPFGYTLALFLSDGSGATKGDSLGRPIARLRIAPELARALSVTLSQAVSEAQGQENRPQEAQATVR